MLDVSLMKTYVEEVWSKQKLYKIAKTATENDFQKSDYELFIGSLEELRVARSYAVQDTLVDDSLVLSGTDQKIKQVSKHVGNMKTELNLIKDFMKDNVSKMYSSNKKVLFKSKQLKLIKTNEIKEKQTSIMKRITSKHEKRLHLESDQMVFQEDIDENEDQHVKEEVERQITKRTEGMSNKNPSQLSMAIDESEVDDSLKELGTIKKVNESHQKSNNTNQIKGQNDQH